MAIREQSKSDDGGGEPSLQSLHRAPEPAARTDGSGAAAPARGGKRPWTAPRLIPYGDVRALTLGGSTGVFESGQPGTFRP
jgi:hypothetical protein